MREPRAGSWGDTSLGGQDLDDAQPSYPAGWTQSWGGVLSAGCRCLQVRGGQEGSCDRGRDGQELAATGQFVLAGAVG